MGGASSEVGPDTTDLLVEAAHFDPITVARTARRHKLSTEASRRFERGVDLDLAAAAAELAVRLLVEHGGGTAGPGTDVDQRRPVPPITMPVDLPSRIVGSDYPRDEVVAILTEIGCQVAEDGGEDTLTVRPPSWRPDLRIGEDLVEEVARLHGYEHIRSVLPIAPPGRGLTTGQRVRRSVARALADHGLTEVLSYPFISAGVHDQLGLPADDPRRTALRLANPLSEEQPFLRTNVLSTLLDTLRRNIGRGATDLGVFEIGLVTRPDSATPMAPRPGVGGRPSDDDLAALQAAVPSQPRRLGIALSGYRVLPGWTGPGRLADWTDALDAALLVARTVGIEPTVTADGEHLPWHPGRCARLEIDGTLFGHAGELHPKVIAALDLPPRTVAAEVDLDVLIAARGDVVQAIPISTFPLAKEDVALVADAGVPAGSIQEALVAGAGELLESIRLFDVYTGPQLGEGKKSLAFALRFRAGDRTLTAQETAAARDAAVAEATNRTGAVLRS
jgi:phenylalanyl-tRNA synthetase beta chain